MTPWFARRRPGHDAIGLNVEMGRTGTASFRGSLEDPDALSPSASTDLMSEDNFARPAEDRNACLFERSSDMTVRAASRDVLARNTEW